MKKFFKRAWSVFLDYLPLLVIILVFGAVIFASIFREVAWLRFLLRK